MRDYSQFLESKSDLGSGNGFAPIEIPDFLKPFQKFLVEWSIRRGRSLMMAQCGMGKTPCQLTWADNVVRHTDGRVLILTPLAVSQQTLRESVKFGFDAEISRDGKFNKRLVIANYERLHYFSPNDFDGVVLDEAGILKNFTGVTKNNIIEFMRTINYRLLCTAMAAPNDFVELGNHSEALGELGYMDMITRFFRDETKSERPFYVTAWSRQMKKVLKGHAEHDFWRWVCSWARACRQPSDLGEFDDTEFVLPELRIKEHVVEARTRRPGFLFDLPAQTLPEQTEERRRTIRERCELVTDLVDHGYPAVCWCHLNPEGDMLAKMIKGSVQVSGKDSDEDKERKFLGFQDGSIRVLVIKPRIGAFGLNWQHCFHSTFFISHSYEQMYQAVRRFHRFGQMNDVEIDVVSAEGESGIVENWRRKSVQADLMFAKIVELMNDHLNIKRSNTLTKKESIPEWLSPIK